MRPLTLVILAALGCQAADGELPNSPTLAAAGNGSELQAEPTCSCTNGSDGQDGTSCSVSSTSTGATVSCTDGTQAIITNGTPGSPGEPGRDGERGLTGDRGDTGPKGDTGSPGSPGRDGIDGRDGASGSDGVVSAAMLYIAQGYDLGYSGDKRLVTAVCDAGDFAISGGCNYTSSSVVAELLHSYPAQANGMPADGAPEGWSCRWATHTSTSLYAKAVCVDVTP